MHAAHGLLEFSTLGRANHPQGDGLALADAEAPLLEADRLLRPLLSGLASRFQLALSGVPGGPAAFDGGAPQGTAQAAALQLWFSEFLLPGNLAARNERRGSLGRLLASHSVPAGAILGAIGELRAGLLAGLWRSSIEPERQAALSAAVCRRLDADLAALFAAFHEAAVAQARQAGRQQAHEQAATPGPDGGEAQGTWPPELTERLVALGRLSAGFAHAVRNPLNAALLQIEVADRLIGKHVPSPAADQIARRIGLATEELRRLERLLAEYLAFADPRPLVFRAAALRPLLAEEARRLERESACRGIRMVVTLPEKPLVVDCDPDQLGDLVGKLLCNALEAVPNGGTIELAAEPRANGACIEVHDNGSGIPRVLLGRIFDPFFTTKETGTGLGLAIVHSRVQLHGGSIRVESVPGRGTTFELWFPGTSPADPRPVA